MIVDFRCKRFRFWLGAAFELFNLELVCILYWIYKGCKVEMIPEFIGYMLLVAFIVIGIAWALYKHIYFGCKCDKKYLS